MKVVQLIDDAENCVYDCFGIDEESFKMIFTNGTDICFIEDIYEREDNEIYSEIFNKMYSNPVDKKNIPGIHGTIFFWYGI